MSAAHVSLNGSHDQVLRASEYAPRLRAARAFAGLKQTELAAALGVDVQTVKRREAGLHQPRRGDLVAIAAICGVPFEFLERGFFSHD